tara:strand:+ start:119 stop:637 length:519 start_codon:yes stop_codon:yes gene_type:complete
VPFDGEQSQGVFGAIRFDKYLDNGVTLTMEGWHAQGSVGVVMVHAQRTYSPNRDAKRPWARFNVSNERFTASVNYDGHFNLTGYQGLSTTVNFVNNSYKLTAEGQANFTPHPDLQLVVGGTVGVEEMDSFDECTGTQSFLFRPITADREGVFGQASWDLSERVTLVGALRGD